jgi:hypothetical protein
MSIYETNQQFGQKYFFLNAGYIWLHIRSVGGWTQKLYDFFKHEKEKKANEIARTTNRRSNNNLVRFENGTHEIEINTTPNNRPVLRRTRTPNKSPTRRASVPPWQSSLSTSSREM